MSPRFDPAAQHELSRAGLLAELPGEVLSRLAARMERETLPPGGTTARAGEAGGGRRFYVVVSGLLAAAAPAGGARRILRPGDCFGELAAGADASPAATVRALSPSVIASCDAAAFDEFVRPLLARQP